jgi:hypothetical protein
VAVFIHAIESSVSHVGHLRPIGGHKRDKQQIVAASSQAEASNIEKVIKLQPFYVWIAALLSLSVADVSMDSTASLT